MISATTPMKPPATSQTKIQKLFCEAGAGSRPMGFSGEKSRAEAPVGRAAPLAAVPPRPAGPPALPARPLPPDPEDASGTGGTGEDGRGGPLRCLAVPPYAGTAGRTASVWPGPCTGDGTGDGTRGGTGDGAGDGAGAGAGASCRPRAR